MDCWVNKHLVWVFPLPNHSVWWCYRHANGGFINNFIIMYGMVHIVISIIKACYKTTRKCVNCMQLQQQMVLYLIQVLIAGNMFFSTCFSVVYDILTPLCAFWKINVSDVSEFNFKHIPFVNVTLMCIFHHTYVLNNCLTFLQSFLIIS